VQVGVVQLLPRAVAAGNQEGIHRRLVGEAVIGNDGKAGLRLHRPHRFGDQEGIKLGVQPPRHRKHPGRRRVIDDLGILEDIDAQPESLFARHATISRKGPPSPETKAGRWRSFWRPRPGGGITTTVIRV